MSSLGNNSKLLNANQVNALEGLFAKRLNMTTPTECNTWLRKRLVDEYKLHEPLNDAQQVQMIGGKLENLYGNDIISVESGFTYKTFCLPVSWQQQTGPSCGISVINMLNESVKVVTRPLDIPLTVCTECVKNKEKVKKETALRMTEEANALRTAIDLCVSTDGELFCAYNFSLVAAKALNLHTVVSDDWSVETFMNELLSGFPIAVPYDRSLSDHRPGCFSGTKAHWCIVNGFILKEGVYEEANGDNYLMNLPNGQSLVSMVTQLEGYPSKVKEELKNGKINEDVLLVCTHSMSKSPFISSYQELFQSNQQLMSSKSKFFLAPEDLIHLRGKFLTVNR